MATRMGKNVGVIFHRLPALRRIAPLTQRHAARILTARDFVDFDAGFVQLGQDAQVVSDRHRLRLTCPMKAIYPARSGLAS